MPSSNKPKQEEDRSGRLGPLRGGWEPVRKPKTKSGTATYPGRAESVSGCPAGGLYGSVDTFLVDD